MAKKKTKRRNPNGWIPTGAIKAIRVVGRQLQIKTTNPGMGKKALSSLKRLISGSRRHKK